MYVRHGEAASVQINRVFRVPLISHTLNIAMKTFAQQAGTFRPYLHADGERTVPSEICIFVLTGGHGRWTTIEVPKCVLELSGDEQLAALQKLMKRYRQKYKGAVPFFGDLVGFRFVRLLDYLSFDADGRFVGVVNRPFRSSPCSVRLS